MQKVLSKCPTCGETLCISSLCCPDCGLELKNQFELSPFDRLDREQTAFLQCFLKCKGNLKKLQSEMTISYPAAKKRLSELLRSLSIEDGEEQRNEQEVIDVSSWHTDEKSIKASEIVKNKLKTCGGRTVIPSARGILMEIYANTDGSTFSCDKLPKLPKVEYGIFDTVADALVALGGKARKGNGRNYKVGDPECSEETVAGIIAMRYFGKRIGESTLDPVFVIAAIMEWAEIAINDRGYVTLKTS